MQDEMMFFSWPHRMCGAADALMSCYVCRTKTRNLNWEGDKSVRLLGNGKLQKFKRGEVLFVGSQSLENTLLVSPNNDVFFSESKPPLTFGTNYVAMFREHSRGMSAHSSGSVTPSLLWWRWTGSGDRRGALSDSCQTKACLTCIFSNFVLLWWCFGRCCWNGGIFRLSVSACIYCFMVVVFLMIKGKPTEPVLLEL